MSLRTVLGRALRLRCPRCGEGRLFRGAFTMHASCGSRGLKYEPEPGYYVGAMYLNYGATSGILMTAGLLLVERVPLPALSVGLAAFGLVFPLVFFRYSRSLWLGLQSHLESRTQD